MKEAILNCLPGDYPWADRFTYFEEIGSTNDTLRTLAKQGAPHGTVVMADRQTGGHGRLGRSFHSPGGMGIYLSMLLRPDCVPAELMHLTCATAEAMCDAVAAATGLRPGIKWTNDLVWEKKKLGGILTELGFTPQGKVAYAIIGIGINCCQKEADFAPEIRTIAGSLSMAVGKPVERAVVAAAMMEQLWKMDARLLTGKEEMLRAYRSDCVTIGQDISLVRCDEIRHGHALDVDSDGALVVSFADGHTETVNSGEVSVRGMYGYL